MSVQPPTERQKMLAGEMYDPFDPELVAGRERARDLCLALNNTREAQQGERRRILNDLRTLRRLLLAERLKAVRAAKRQAGRGFA